MNPKCRCSIRRACIALLVTCMSTACFTMRLADSADPVDRGRVRRALRTSDGGVALDFENLTTGWGETIWNLPDDRWCPVLVLSGAELDQIFSQPSSAAPDPSDWPSVLIARDRLKERTAGEPVGDTPVGESVLVAHVRRFDWTSWPPADAAGQPSSSSLQIAFDTRCRDPIVGPRRSFALLLVRDEHEGRRRAVLFIEPSPGRPALPLVAIGVATDLATFLGAIALASL